MELDDVEPNEFSAAELVAALKALGMDGVVTQTGGGTATIYVDNDPAHRVIVAGPGVYDWHNPGESRFTTGDFYYGADYMDRDGNFYDGPEPEGHDVAPGTSVADIARAIADHYTQTNN